MSTATAFTHAGYFPFCVSEISGSVRADANYVGNLTLATVMQFLWNLETLEITAVGTATRTTGGGTTNLAAGTVFSIEPLSSDVFDEARVDPACVWFDAFGFAVFASSLSIKQPRERVCPGASASTEPGLVLTMQMDDAATGLQNVVLGLWVGTDPLNAGKYRVYFYIQLQRLAGGGGPPLVVMLWKSDSAVPGGYTAITSGTLTIGGLSFNWYSFHNGADSTTGGTLSATSSDFSY